MKTSLRGEAGKRHPPRYRIAYVDQHPVQYFAQMFRKLAARPEIDLTVYYCTDFGVTPSFEADFQTEVAWDTPLLDGYRHVFLRNLSPLRFRGSRAFFWRLVNPGIIPELLRRDFDAVIVHGYHLATYWLAVATGRAGSTPVILSGEPVHKPRPRSLRNRLREAALRQLYSGAAACLAVGKSSRDFYRDLGVPPDRIFHSPLAVDNERFMKESHRWRRERNTILKELSLPLDRPVVLFAGKLIDWKRPSDLLDAALACKTRLSLLYVGDGPLRNSLKDRTHTLPDRVSCAFAGFRNQSEMPRYYAASDLLALPSGDGEAFGLVLNEAMCASLPVIASHDVPGAQDLIQEGVNGFTYPTGQTHRLASLIDLTVSQTGKAARMGRASLEIIGKWNLEVSVDGIVEAVRMVARSGTKRIR